MSARQIEQCTNCSGTIGNLETAYLFNGSVVCGICDKKLREPTHSEAITHAIPSPIIQVPQTTRVFRSTAFPVCQFCGGEMVRSKIGRGLILRLFFNLSLIFWGLILTIFLWFTIIMPIIGITMILLGLFRSSNRKKVLKCTQCGAVADRV
jgi:hypothetical protein